MSAESDATPSSRSSDGRLPSVTAGDGETAGPSQGGRSSADCTTLQTGTVLSRTENLLPQVSEAGSSFGKLNIDCSSKHGLNCTGSDGSVASASVSQTTLQQPGSSSLHVHSFTSRRENAPQQSTLSGQKGGASSISCDQESCVSHQTLADKIPDEHSMLLASVVNVQGQQKDLPGRMSITFEAFNHGNSWKWRYPQEIDVAKWSLLKKNGMENKLAMTGDRKSVVVAEDITRGVVTIINGKKLLHDEAENWFKACVKIMSEHLKGIQTVMFRGADTIKCLHTILDSQGFKLCHQSGLDNRWLTVCAINSAAMDVFMERAVQILEKKTDWKMVIKLPCHTQNIQKLEKLGFKQHFEQHNQGVKLFLDLKDREYILDCQTDLRHSFTSEIQEFLNNLKRIVLEVPDLCKTILLDSMGFFHQEMEEHHLHYLVRECQNAVEVLSPSSETLSWVKEVVIKKMTHITIRPFSEAVERHFLRVKAQHPYASMLFYQRGADGCSMEVAGWTEVVNGILQQTRFMSWSTVSIVQASVKTDISEKLSQQDLSHSASGSSTKSQCFDSADRQSRGQAQAIGTTTQPSKEEQSGRMDRSSQGDRPDSATEPSGKQDQAGISVDNQTRKKENSTFPHPLSEFEKSYDQESQANFQEGRYMKGQTPTEPNRRSSPSTVSSPGTQDTAGGMAPPPDSRTQTPVTSEPPSHRAAQGSLGPTQEQAKRMALVQTRKPGSTEMHSFRKYFIPADLVQLLQVSDVVVKLKAHLMDIQCMVDCRSVAEGFIRITAGREKDMSSTLQELFHHEVIEVGDDDPDAEKALKSFKEKYAGKVAYIFKEGRWYVCVTADIKDDIHHEAEKLRHAHCVVPLPQYATEFLALEIDRMNNDIKQEVNPSVNIRICDDDDEKRGIKLSSDKKFMKQAVEWLHNLVMTLEVMEKPLTVEEALFFQDLEGQKKIQKMEKDLCCRIDSVVNKDWSGFSATAPSGQRLLVCRDTMAATDCDYIVLPLCIGQTEWTPLQKWILSRSLLSENIAAYHEQCQENPISLQGNADFDGKTIIMVSVPAQWDGGAAKEKERITASYMKAFQLCQKPGCSVTVCTKQSPNISIRKSAKPLLYAVIETFSAEQPSTSCETVVIYTDSAQDSMATIQIVKNGLPAAWRQRPPRVPRSTFGKVMTKLSMNAPKPISGKGIIKVCLGKIQETEADVIVNSTNRLLNFSGGAVEHAIKSAAGPQMEEACENFYPNGIPVNGVAVTDSFQMKNAKKIYHIALSRDQFEPFQEDKRKELLYDLRQVILHCLVKASLEEHTSIAFPTLGSGNLKYPCDAVARVMFSTISMFFREMPSTTLRKVIIVVFPKNLDAVQALRMEELTQLYTFSSEEKQTDPACEVRMKLNNHMIQVIHGKVFQKPWISDVCVHGKLTSERGESCSKAEKCESIVVQNSRPQKADLQQAFKAALKKGTTIQIAADTLRCESLKDIASAVESVLSHGTPDKYLVTVIFSDQEKADEFLRSLQTVESGHVDFDEEKEAKGQLFVCSSQHGKEIACMVEVLKVSGRYKKQLDAYQKACEGQKQKQDKTEKEHKGPDQVSIRLSTSVLENAGVSQIPNTSFTTVEGGVTDITVRLEDLVNTSIELVEGIGKKTAEREADQREPSAGPEEKTSDEWNKTVDALEIEAIRFLMGEEFDQTFNVKEIQDGFLLTFKGASSKELENQMDALRREDVQLTAEEVAKLGETVDVRSDGLEAFVKTVADMDKAVVYAFDYNAMTKAKHLVTVKAGRVRVTSRGRRRFDPGNAGQQDQMLTQPGDISPHGAASDLQRKDFTTLSGIKVSVYKTDITKLPVDAIVNAANENLAHGGGVAAVIARAAGFSLEEEGRQHLQKHGPLKVSEVVETTAGSLTCKKVLHAVGPRWTDYPDKAVCRQVLTDTVFNSLQKASSLGFRSVALPSISAAIFGVPQSVCAECYLSAVKLFDVTQGMSSSLKEIHFVDINDTMISTIQTTFSTHWDDPASRSPGSQSSPTMAGDRNRQEQSSQSAQNPSGRSQEKPLNTVPQTGASHDGETGHQGQSSRHTAGEQVEPVGFPCFREVATNDDVQVQVLFKGLDLTLILQKQSVTDMKTESVILWQDENSIMKDGIWRQFKNKLTSQAKSSAEKFRKEMTTAEKVYGFKTNSKQYVFVVLSSSAAYGEDRLRDFMEQALNKVDLDKKKTVAIPRQQKEGKGKPSNKDHEATEVFISSLYRAVKNYARRSSRSIREIHVVETDPKVLQVMVEKVNTLVTMDWSLLDQTNPQPSPQSANPANSLPHSTDPCVICFNQPANPKRLKCGHVFCASCPDKKWFQGNPICPTCKSIQGVVLGDQPEDGTMKMAFLSYGVCEGFPPGKYTVSYSFPSGYQKRGHPSPGGWYTGTTRTAFLPDTTEGRKVLMLLKVAFDRRLIFTIGTSASSGYEGIIWNDIHHKTNFFGGPQNFGYPDAGYLTRVQKELAAKGVTEEDLEDIQKDFIGNPAIVQSKYQYYRNLRDHFGTWGSSV